MFLVGENMPGEKQPSIAGFAARDGLLMPPPRLLLPGDISQSPSAILEAPTGFEFGEDILKLQIETTSLTDSNLKG